jgi:hypothetical protein
MTVIQHIRLKGYATSQELERMFNREELVKAISLHIGFGDIVVDRIRIDNDKYNAYYIIRK